MSLETSPQFQNQRLLIVDDEPAVLKMVKTILLRAGYRPVTCESAEVALELLQEESFDCIITDAMMPLMSGFDLVQQIRDNAKLSHIPILMLTRKRDQADVKRAVHLGVTDYILKPIDEHLLINKVELCLKKGITKRNIIECGLHGQQSRGQLTLTCEISSISEAYITCHISFRIPPNLRCEINASVFEEIGIKPPIVKLITCDPLQGLEIPKPNSRSRSEDPTAYEAKFSLIGVPEPDLRKIRTWLNREEIRRRK